MAGVRAGRGLLLLGRHRAERGVVDVVGVVMLAVIGLVVVAVVAVAVSGDAVEPRADEDGEQEPGEGQRRNEGDQQVEVHRPTP